MGANQVFLTQQAMSYSSCNVASRTRGLEESASKHCVYSLQIRVHRKFAVEEGDHLTMLNVYEAFIKVSTAATQKAPSMHLSTGSDLGARGFWKCSL